MDANFCSSSADMDLMYGSNEVFMETDFIPAGDNRQHSRRAIYLSKLVGDNCTMEDILQHRRKRLMALIAVNFDGNKSAFARAVGRSPNYIHRLCLPLDNKDSKGLGESLARRLEESLRLPMGWFDTNQPHPEWRMREPPTVQVNARRQTVAAVEYVNDQAEYAMIKRRQINLSAGNGNLVFEEEDAPPLAFRQAWLESNGLDPEMLVVAYVKGDSMSPTIRDGDTVLINTADRGITDGKIYAMRQGDHLRIKRLSRRTLSILIISDNRDFDPEEIPIQRADELHIIGRVVWSAGSL